MSDDVQQFDLVIPHIEYMGGAGQLPTLNRITGNADRVMEAINDEPRYREFAPKVIEFVQTSSKPGQCIELDTHGHKILLYRTQ